MIFDRLIARASSPVGAPPARTASPTPTPTKTALAFALGMKIFGMVDAVKNAKSKEKVNIPKDTGDFRLADRKVVDVINSLPEHNKFLRGLFSWVGFKQAPFEYERKERFAGKTKYPLKKMLAFAMDGITSFSIKPIRLITTLGFFIFVISLGMLVYSLVRHFTGHTSIGWSSMFVSIWAIGGLQILSIGVIGEYIGKIYMETKERPKFIIEKELD